MMTGIITLILTGLLRVLRTRRALVLENLALRHQLTVLQRTAPRPRLRPSDRLFFSGLRSPAGAAWAARRSPLKSAGWLPEWPSPIPCGARPESMVSF